MNLKRTVSALATFALLTGSMLGAAKARTTPASTGRPAVGPQELCFSVIQTEGSVQNTGTSPFPPQQVSCANTLRWVIPLPTDNGGSKPVTVAGRSPFTGTQCRTFGFSRFGTMQSGSNVAGVPNNNLFTDMNMNNPAAFLPGGGILYVECDVAIGARLSTAIYNQ
jgi:hypothetical protein